MSAYTCREDVVDVPFFDAVFDGPGQPGQLVDGDAGVRGDLP